MRKLINLFVFISAIVYPQQITLSNQAAIDLCNIFDIKEGIVDILWLEVDKLWHLGKYEKIFPVINLIAEIYPAEIEAYSVGSWFLINGIAPKVEGEKKGEIKNYAINFLKKGIRRNPENYKLYWELAWIYYRDGKYNTSLQYLEKAEKYPHEFVVENLKAHIFMKKGEREKAIREWKKIKEKYPEQKNIAERFIKKLERENDS
ncbi:hypothetical protein J7L87_02095 [bacterium]|nr:hypothetical protein [bacterium]